MECSTCKREKPVEAYVTTEETIESLRGAFNELREENPELYEFYRNMAEHEEIPLVTLLSKGFQAGLPQVVAEYNLCPECFQPLDKQD